MYSLYPKLQIKFPDWQQGFEQVLKKVVFSDGRPGAGHVELGRFIIRSVNGGASLNAHTWEHVVKEGAHLTQAMVLTETNINPRRCLSADCNGTLGNNRNCWFVDTHILSLNSMVPDRLWSFANVPVA